MKWCVILIISSIDISLVFQYKSLKGARYLLIIHEVLVAMDFFSAGAQDEALEEESQRLAS